MRNDQEHHNDITVKAVTKKHWKLQRSHLKALVNLT